MRAFVTGINGFAGSHLAHVLLEAGYDVRGISDKPEYRGTLSPDIPVHLGDICSSKSIEPHLTEFRPDIVFHLAGFASPSLSRRETLRCLSVNVMGTANVLEAVATARPDAKVIAVTTSHFHAARGGTITEQSSIEPSNPYEISKTCAHHLCGFYHAKRGLQVIEARPTNHFGPGQQPGFVVADFAGQIAKIVSGETSPSVRVGSLDAARDLLYVKDVAEAYLALARKGTPGEAYVIGSDRPVRIKQILDMLLELGGKEIAVEVDPDRLRPGEPAQLSVDSAKLRRDTGWKPATELREGLRLTLEYWMNKVKSER